MSTPRLTQLKEVERRYSFADRAERGFLWAFSVYDDDVDIATPLKILWRTGAKKVHLRRDLSAIGGTISQVAYIGPTVTEDQEGDAVEIYNQNNASENEPLLKMFVGPTVTENGDQCFPTVTLLGGTSAPTRATVSLSDRTNRILEANTDYLVIITATADNTKVVYSAEFFED